MWKWGISALLRADHLDTAGIFSGDQLQLKPQGAQKYIRRRFCPAEPEPDLVIQYLSLCVRLQNLSDSVGSQLHRRRNRRTDNIFTGQSISGMALHGETGKGAALRLPKPEKTGIFIVKPKLLPILFSSFT